MKKIILLLLLFPTIVFAQHLKFMGIPIDGDINNFGKQLQAKGFKIDKADDRHMFFIGKFARKDAYVGVLSSTKSNKVCRVIVLFQKEKTWSSLKSEYNNLKEQYSVKYELEEESHSFVDPYYEGDGYEMSAVEAEKCDYWAFFKAEYGTILLEISSNCYISVAYEDNSNIEKEKAERNSKIQEDI